MAHRISPVDLIRLWVFRSLWSIAFIFIWFGDSFSQNGFLISGCMVDFDKKDTLVHGTVTAVDIGDSTFQLLSEVGKDGFLITLPFDRVMHVVFSSPDHVTKLIEIDTRNVEIRDQRTGFGMNMSVAMVTPLPEVDYSILELPFGICIYKSRKGFSWDKKHLKTMQPRQMALIERHRAKRRELGLE